VGSAVVCNSEGLTKTPLHGMFVIVEGRSALSPQSELAVRVEADRQRQGAEITQGRFARQSHVASIPIK